ncbi:MAG: VUT family protein [Planctomycetes bacterium]|nr:VUT family protein [Planctomycetota bacterium]NOG55687.1 queuosine precursor transporter [Planctomycetota bacterium]
MASTRTPNPQPDLLHPIEASALHARRERVFLVLAGLFLGTLAMLNILGISRFIILAGWGADGTGGHSLRWGVPASGPGALNFAIAVGVLPYPITFLCTDLISEFYGRRRANFVVFVGFLINIWVMFILWLGSVLPGFGTLDPVTHMPPVPEFSAADGKYIETGWTFFQVKTLAFGAVTASMIAYLTAQFVDVYVFHFWKRLTKGKHLWLRNNGSTLVSQLVDTVAVILITYFWAKALPPAAEGQSVAMHLFLFIATGYAFKFVAALLDTPLIYLAVRLLSPYLQIDPAAEHDADKQALPNADGTPTT